MHIFIEPFWHNTYQQFPLTLVDVGARGGLPPIWKQAYPYLKIIGFEPESSGLEELIKVQNKIPTKYFGVALSNQQTSHTLHITRHPSDSSFFKPNRSFLERFPHVNRFDVMKTLELQTDTLDSQLSTIPFHSGRLAAIFCVL